MCSILSKHRPVICGIWLNEKRPSKHTMIFLFYSMDIYVIYGFSLRKCAMFVLLLSCRITLLTDCECMRGCMHHTWRRPHVHVWGGRCRDERERKGKHIKLVRNKGVCWREEGGCEIVNFIYLYVKPIDCAIDCFSSHALYICYVKAKELSHWRKQIFSFIFLEKDALLRGKGGIKCDSNCLCLCF